MGRHTGFAMHNYFMIDRDSKKNINFQTVPFCIERIAVPKPDKEHIHDYSQLTIVTSGKAVLTVNNQSETIREGDVYFVNSYSAHALKNNQKLEVINILFYLGDLMKYVRNLRDYPGFQELFVLQAPTAGEEGYVRKMHLKYETLLYISQIADVLLREIDQQRPGAETMVQSYFLILVTCLAREFEMSHMHKESDGNKLYKAVLYMDQHFTEQISLEDLAKMSYLSERQFRRLFTQRYGISPTRHMQRLRINKARYLLRNSELNINEIAQSTGFVDSNYFTRQFKNETGISPKQYRAMQEQAQQLGED